MAVLMGASGNGAEPADGAADYLRGIWIGFTPIMLYGVLSAACQLDSAKARVRKASLVYFVWDVVLDYAAVKLDPGVFGIAFCSYLFYYTKSAGFISIIGSATDIDCFFLKVDFSTDNDFFLNTLCGLFYSENIDKMTLLVI